MLIFKRVLRVSTFGIACQHTHTHTHAHTHILKKRVQYIYIYLTELFKTTVKMYADVC